MRRLIVALMVASLVTAFVPQSAGAAQLRYVALGDSVAAGMGLPAGSETTDIDKLCGRSSQAYPGILAREGNMLHGNWACRGATLWDGLLSDQEFSGGTDVASQLAGLAGARPDVVTMTIGANDRQWIARLMYCHTNDCSNMTDWTYLATKAKLYSALNRVKQSGAWSVTVTHYYDPFEGCRTIGGVTAQEIALLRGQVRSLNTAISETAAKFPGVNVAKPSFAGHGMCSSQPWMQGINSPAPFHPNAAGQVAIARSIQAVW